MGLGVARGGEGTGNDGSGEGYGQQQLCRRQRTHLLVGQHIGAFRGWPAQDGVLCKPAARGQLGGGQGERCGSGRRREAAARAGRSLAANAGRSERRPSRPTKPAMLPVAHSMRRKVFRMYLQQRSAAGHSSVSFQLKGLARSMLQLVHGLPAAYALPTLCCLQHAQQPPRAGPATHSRTMVR